MAIIQAAVDLVEICAQHGIKEVIICPGSRSAAISIAFARHPAIHCYSLSDERSAAFVAMGMAIAYKRPTAVVCTSGSAVYNLAPAMAEAYFQQIPLLLITADRPLEWIHQNDGQTIYQNGIFGQHVKAQYQLLSDYEHSDQAWYLNRSVNEAIHIATDVPAGPVHLNMHIREPFYPSPNEDIKASSAIRIIQKQSAELRISYNEIEIYKSELQKYKKVLIASGQNTYNDYSNIHSSLFGGINASVLLSDVTGNIENSTKFHDHYLSTANDGFAPELLITFGESFLSKSFKKYIQKHKPLAHWHIQLGAKIKDPLQSITHLIQQNPNDFLGKIFNNYQTPDQNFVQHWQQAEAKTNEKIIKYFGNNTENTELQYYYKIIQSVSNQALNIHLANSMAVRYANMLGLRAQENTQIFANRGTSGIDGCLSTAVGIAMAHSHIINLVLIGDVAFQYDKNALWNSYLPNNLRIIVMNNGGGGIFRMIDGPSQQPELEEFFETKQNFTAKNTCADADIEYIAVTNIEQFDDVFRTFLDGHTSKCMEIFTNGQDNQNAFLSFKKTIQAE